MPGRAPRIEIPRWIQLVAVFGVLAAHAIGAHSTVERGRLGATAPR